ncbi:MAG: response regulator, partial [Erythrobacter sp.]|nr:response regulator [Erythrobacter sp.]
MAEDEYITAFDLCDTFEEAGYEVQGPHAGISSAMLACQKARPDVALLDVELADGLSLELAQKLLDENVPVILHSE